MSRYDTMNTGITKLGADQESDEEAKKRKQASKNADLWHLLGKVAPIAGGAIGTLGGALIGGGIGSAAGGVGALPGAAAGGALGGTIGSAFGQGAGALADNQGDSMEQPADEAAMRRQAKQAMLLQLLGRGRG